MKFKPMLWLVSLLTLFLVSTVMSGCVKNEAEAKDSPGYSVITEYSQVKDIACNAKSDDSVLLIDLRDNSDFEYAHIDGATNVPFDDDGQWLLRYLEKNEFRGRDIYLMCGAGKKSAKAFNLLVEQGYPKVHYVAFGFDEFKENEGDSSLEGASICDCVKNKK